MTTGSKIEFYGYKQASEILGVDVKVGIGPCPHCAYSASKYMETCFETNCWGGIMLDSNKYNTTPKPITDDSSR